MRALIALLACLVPMQALAQLPDPVLFRVRLELGDVAQVREWLQGGLPTDFLGDEIGTGLMISAWEGSIPLMELFVAHGADVNKANALNEQALMHAAWRGHLDAVKWLLDRGAQLNREPPSWTALHYAVFAGREEVAQYLVRRGADIDARSPNGSTPLMMAAYEGHEPLARRLVELGADTGVKNERGDGALEWAMKHRHFGIARVVADRQQFAAAASLPKERWGEPVRSVPPPPQPVAAAGQAAPPPAPDDIELLMDVRRMLATRGLTQSVAALDRQIAALRAKRARESRPATVLEISAGRNAPREQRARLVTERAPKAAVRPPVTLDRAGSRAAR